jgi:hypothetical protein
MTWDPHPSDNGHTVRELPEPRAEPAEARRGKDRKREAKRRRDAERQPESYERFRILLEVIGKQRQVVDLEDHRARYALLIMGGINAAVLLVATGAAGTGRLSGTLPPWLLAAVLVHVAATLVFILAAVDCLRPRAIQRKGLLHWEGMVKHDLVEYETAWSQVRMDQLNREAVVVAHMLARLISEKFRANRRLYGGLTGLVTVGAVLLAILALTVAVG